MVFSSSLTQKGGKKEDGLSLPSVLPSTFPHGWDPALLSHLCAVEAEGSVLYKYKAVGCGCVLCVSSLCTLRLEHAMFAVQQQYRFPLQLNTLKCWWEEGPNEQFFFQLGVLDSSITALRDPGHLGPFPCHCLRQKVIICNARHK